MSAIGVDVDDVLYPWYAAAHNACTLAGITNGHTATSWHPYREYGCDADTWYAALATATLDGTLYGRDPLPGAVDALASLAAAGHTIHLVTARGFLTHGAAIRAQTIAWLDQHQVPHDTLTFSCDKTVVPCEWFVDDNADNVTAVAAAGARAYLVDQSWNQHSTHPHRVPDVGAFARTILEEHA